MPVEFLTRSSNAVTDVIPKSHHHCSWRAISILMTAILSSLHGAREITHVWASRFNWVPFAF